MTRPYPDCCRCWNCDMEPDYLSLIAVVTANPCSTIPDGTHTVGAAVGSTYWESNRAYKYIPTTRLMQSIGTAQQCTWTWIYDLPFVECEYKPGDHGGNLRDSAAIGPCEVNDYYRPDFMNPPSYPLRIDGEYRVYRQIIYMHLKWSENPRQIIAVIQQNYIVTYCIEGEDWIFAGDDEPQFNYEATLTVSDLYVSDVGLACDSLPVTLNHYERYGYKAQLVGGVGTGSGVGIDTVNYGAIDRPASVRTWDRYTFQADPALSYVTVGYV